MRGYPDRLVEIELMQESSWEAGIGEWTRHLSRLLLGDARRPHGGEGDEWARYTSPERRRSAARAIVRATDEPSRLHILLMYMEAMHSWAPAPAAMEPGWSRGAAHEQARARTTPHHARASLPPSELHAEIAALQEANRWLDDRVQRLERKLEALLDGPAERDMVPVDPHTRWIEENLDTLRRYPDEWVALHPDRGIVFHAADDDEFATMLDALPPGERDEMLAFHTSMYL